VKAPRTWLLLTGLVAGALGWGLGRLWPPQEPHRETVVPVAVERVVEVAEVEEESSDAADKPNPLVGEVNRLEAEVQESADVMVALAARNASLTERAAGLERQAEELTFALAAERASVDELRLARERAEVRTAVLPEIALDTAPVPVVDVDREEGWIALGAGADAGLKAGMKFHVLRDDRRVADVRVVEVRPKLAAVTVVGEAEEWPAPGDRAIPVRPGDR